MKNFAPQISLMTMLFLTSFVIKAQNVGINATGVAPGASAGLDIDFTNKGLLIPRVSIGNVAAAAPVTAPATSLLVYNTNAAITGGTGVGYYYWDGSKWVNFWTGNNFGVDNGLYYNTGASKVRLGGALVENTTVTQAGFQMDWDLTGTGDFNVMDAGVTRFSVQDNGNVTVGSTANTAAFNVTGESYFSDDLYLRDGAVTAGDILLRLYDSSDDGVIDVYQNNTMNHRIHGNGITIFNDQQLGIADFRIGSLGNANMFFVDAGTNRVGIGTSTPSEELDVVGEIEFSGSLEPNALPGTSGQALLSAGAGVAPTWGVDLSGLVEISRWYYPPLNLSPSTTYILTANIPGVTSTSSATVNLVGDWGVSPSNNITIHHVEARTGQVRFIVRNNTSFTTYNGMDFIITVLR